jgi:hypothetical protein
VTLREWLACREPAQPSGLAERIAEMAAPFDGSNADIAAQCLAAAEAALPGLLATGESESRTNALDLLAIDALVTYAFEAAAENPARFAEVAQDAMTRLSRLAPSPTA